MRNRDGGRGAPVGGDVAVRRARPLLPESRRRHLFPFGQLAFKPRLAGVNITYKLLYNDTVAMTGGQDPAGQLSVRDVSRNLLNQGVARVLITTEDRGRYRKVDLPRGVDVWDRSRLMEAQEVLAATPGVTVLIHDQACAAENRRDRKRGKLRTPTTRVVINPRICEGCGDCGQISGCLSVQPVETPFGRKTEIDQTTCNFDYSCLEGDCPSFVTVDTKPPGRLRQMLGGATTEADRARCTPRQCRRSTCLIRSWWSRATTSPPASQASVGPAWSPSPRFSAPRPCSRVPRARPRPDRIVSKGRPRRERCAAEPGRADVHEPPRGSASRPVVGVRPARGRVRSRAAHHRPRAHHRRWFNDGDTDRSHDHRPRARAPDARGAGRRIAETTRADQHHWADAQMLTGELFGSTTTANIFVIGMAIQAGCLPISPAYLEEAIALNGVAVETNLAAFRWGRAQVADPAMVVAFISQDDRPRRRTGSPAELVPRIDELGLRLSRPPDSSCSRPSSRHGVRPRWRSAGSLMWRGCTTASSRSIPAARASRWRSPPTCSSSSHTRMSTRWHGS